MRNRIEHRHREGETRVITGFLFLPRTLRLPPAKRTPYARREWRWLERASIQLEYSQWCGWMFAEWAE